MYRTDCPLELTTLQTYCTAWSALHLNKPAAQQQRPRLPVPTKLRLFQVVAHDHVFLLVFFREPIKSQGFKSQKRVSFFTITFSRQNVSENVQKHVFFWLLIGSRKITDHIEMIFLSMECVLLIKIHKNMSKLVIPL